MNAVTPASFGSVKNGPVQALEAETLQRCFLSMADTALHNFIAEKNISHAPFEFGCSAGVSRPFALSARPERCNLCPENFQAGVEIYGGLGDHTGFGFRETSHYVAPTLAWTLAGGATVKISPSFGVTETSAGFLLRFGVSYEIAQFGRMVLNLFRGGRP